MQFLPQEELPGGVREPGDGVSTSQGPPTSLDRVQSMGPVQQEPEPLAGPDPLRDHTVPPDILAASGHAVWHGGHASTALQGAAAHAIDAPIYPPGSLLVVSDPHNPDRWGSR